MLQQRIYSFKWRTCWVGWTLSEYYKNKSNTNRVSNGFSSIDKPGSNRRSDNIGDSPVNGVSSKKQVYKSSKGFRVILNGMDEKKVNNMKKIQSPTNFASALFNGASVRRKDDSMDIPGRGKDAVQRNTSL